MTFRPLFTIFFTIFTMNSFAQELLPIPLNKQLSESQAVIIGRFQDSYVKKNSDGEIMTSASFKIHKSIGLGNKEVLNKNSFSLSYDGGKWQGIRYENKNKPSFVRGRDYLIILEKGKYDYRPYGAKLGVYDVIGRVDQEVVISQAFPSHKQFGSNSLRKFNMWIDSVYGSELKSLSSDKDVIVTRKRNQGRSIASVEDSAIPAKQNISIYWLVVVFGLLGAVRMRHVKSQ